MGLIKLGSLFDGSGGFPLAGVLHGVTPVWASEIEPFPIRVTKLRFPQMKHLGSVTEVNGASIEKVDIITFGSPCQDLSIPGKQAGIHNGERSSLFFEAIRIIKEMRGSDISAGRTGVDVRPRFAVWENVQGAFSSNGGEDFKAVLQAFSGVSGNGYTVPRPAKGKWGHAGCVVGDGWSVAWRLYDAQYWGVPQRRRRIYLIADFATERAGEILFERESVSGDSQPGSEAREGAPADAEGGIGGSRGNGLRLFATHPHDSRYEGPVNVAQTVSSQYGTGGNNTPYVVGSESSHGVAEREFAVCCIGNGQADSLKESKYSGALDCMHDQKAVVYPGLQITSKVNRSNPIPGDPSPTLTVQCSDNYVIAKRRKYIVRRLTPLECARLQGFPDWWVDGAEGSDSAIYKMWGNGIALPCAADVIGRIVREIDGNK